MFAWLTALLITACGSEPEAPPAPPAARPGVVAALNGPPRDVVFIVIDTLRADVTRTAATPVLDALAAEGDQVDRAWSSGTWTVPSIISLFTGQSVRQHGWNYSFPRDTPTGRDTRFPPMPAELPTLAEVLGAAGFKTQGLYANSTLRWKLGFDRGFESWEYCRDRKMPECVAALTTAWKPTDRHFLYLHFLGPHQPLTPTAESRKRHGLVSTHFRKRGALFMRAAEEGDKTVQELYRKTYQAVVEDTDARLGRALDALGPFRAGAMVIVTADHGDMLGEKDQWGHWHFVWEELTHVPLIATRAGDLPDAMRNDTLADLITSTVGVSHDWPSKVSSPLPLVTQREGKLAFSEDGQWKGIWGEAPLAEPGAPRMRRVEARAPDTGAVADPSRPPPPTAPASISSLVQVFDLAAEPAEAAVVPGKEEQLRAGRELWETRTAAGTVTGEPIGAPEEAMEELRALGYVE
jgi:Sulfatase